MKVSAIFGPPGTGKTKSLIEWAGSVSHGIFLSYTRAAAQEAAGRVSKGGHTGIRASTLHSLVFNALGMNRSAIVDADKLKAFAKDTGIPFKGSEPGSDELQEGDEYLSVLQFANNRLMGVMDAYDHFGQPGIRHRYAMFIESYASWKKIFGYMDFDDMLEQLPRLNMPLPIKRKSCVFLDEAQDCSPLQWQTFTHICGKIDADQVVIAGDDDQAVYEWSGADPHGMINFVKEWGGEHSVLKQSHRVPSSVYNQATDVIRKIERRVDKQYSPRDAAGNVERWGFVEDAINNLHGIAPNGALILVRDRFKMEEVKRALNRDLIPYAVYGGYGPWTSKIANALRKGEKVDIPPAWQDFYAQADLSLPLDYTLSTIHGAKGREHDTVIMDLECPARVLNGIALDPDAETRVQYVGLTRAREKLVMCGNNPIV